MLKIDGEKDKYLLKLVNVEKQHIEHLEKINFKKSKIVYFHYQNKKCLVGVFKQSAMVIQGDTKSNPISPFSLLDKYNFYCDNI